MLGCFCLCRRRGASGPARGDKPQLFDRCCQLSSAVGSWLCRGVLMRFIHDVLIIMGLLDGTTVDVGAVMH